MQQVLVCRGAAAEIADSASTDTSGLRTAIVHAAAATARVIDAMEAADAAIICARASDGAKCRGMHHAALEEDVILAAHLPLDSLKKKGAREVVDASPLHARPLWPKRMGRNLAKFQAALALFETDARSLKAGFQVWIEWYRERVEGKPLDFAAELKWATLSEKHRNQPPLTINNYLAQLRGWKVSGDSQNGANPAPLVITEAGYVMKEYFSSGRALVVGIANYENAKKLPEAVLNDARDLSSVLLSKEYCAYRPASVELFLDSEATVDRLRGGLKTLAKNATPDETVIVFFSGHGGRIKAGPDAGAYLVPFNYDPSRVRDTTISSKELTELLANIHAGRLVILLDVCHAAGVGELKAIAPSAQMKAGLEERTYDALAQGAGRVIMASCKSNEFSFALGGMSTAFHALPP